MNAQRPPVREWPAEDRPRERFLTKGADALSDAECLALLLGGGVPGQAALDQAQALLATFGSIAAVADREVQELAWVGGLGIAKAVRLGAAIELSRRLRARPNGGRVRLSSPEEVAGYFGPGLEGKKKEVFDDPVRRHRRIRGRGWQIAADRGGTRNLSATAACVPWNATLREPRSCGRCASVPA